MISGGHEVYLFIIFRVLGAGRDEPLTRRPNDLPILPFFYVRPS